MECLYFMCSHNSRLDSCDFIKIPNDDCAFKIWKRYANFDQDAIKSVADARLCSCHFDGSSNYPIPHYVNAKRTFTEEESNRNDEPERKMSTIVRNGATNKSKENLSSAHITCTKTSNGQHAEIRLATVKDFYSQNEKLFNVAADAVVKGCVSRYHFDDKTHKFIGTVASLDGNEMYEVEDPNLIVGRKTLNDNHNSVCATQPLQEVYVKSEPIDSLDISSCAQNKPINLSLKSLKESFEIVPEKCTSGNTLPSSNDKPDKSNEEHKSNIKFVTTGHVCEKTYENEKQLEIHQRATHTVSSVLMPTRIPLYQCATCSSRKNNTRELNSHMNDEHSSNECGICGAFFDGDESRQQLQRDRKRRSRQNRTEEQREIDRQRHAAVTKERDIQRQKRLEYDRIRAAKRRERETALERVRRLEADRLRSAVRIERETSLEKQRRQEADRLRKVEREKRETAFEKQRRQEADRLGIAERREQETALEKERRLEADRLRAAERRGRETALEKQRRKEADKLGVAERRERETALEKERRLEADRLRAAERRKRETSLEKQRRQEADRLRKVVRMKRRTALEKQRRQEADRLGADERTKLETASENQGRMEVIDAWQRTDFEQLNEKNEIM